MTPSRSLLLPRSFPASNPLSPRASRSHHGPYQAARLPPNSVFQAYLPRRRRIASASYFSSLPAPSRVLCCPRCRLARYLQFRRPGVVPWRGQV
jgi:hypothetical protein